MRKPTPTKGSVPHDGNRSGNRTRKQVAPLGKPGVLDEDDWQHIRRHPSLGADIVHQLKSLDAEQMAQVVRYHHERLDGKGYPDGLQGDEIPVPARIVAICDSFDAMTSDRPYRRGMPVAQAVQILRTGAGVQWDADLVDLVITRVIPQ